MSFFCKPPELSVLQRHFMLSGRVLLSLFLLSLLMLATACSRDGDITAESTIQGNQPNSFAAYLNPMAGLASGDYVIEVNSDNAGAVGDFTLSVTLSDGGTEAFSGSWSADTATISYNIVLFAAGGIDISLQSAVESSLRLLNGNGFLMASDDAVLPQNSAISIEVSRIDSAAYGAAYYAAIDPNGDKATLQKWKQANGFNEAKVAGRIVKPRFRDIKDLGYGRGMSMWTKPDGSLYFFVENFQVRSIPGQEYTSLNLDALLADARKHHFGSNAIEYSTFPYGAGEPCAFDSGAACATTEQSPAKFTKFFTFDATRGDQTAEDHANEVRLNAVNLDGRGDKSMPGACVYCHGGTLRPLRADGSFRDNSIDGTTGNGLNGDVNAKLQLLEVPTFEYGEFSPFTKSEQESKIKQVNMAVYCSYPNLPVAGIAAACSQFCLDKNNTADCDGKGNDLQAIMTCKDPTDTVDCDGNGKTLADVQADIDAAIASGQAIVTGNTLAGQWDGSFAARMTEGWYENPGVAGMFDRDTFDENYVPLAWRYDSSDNMPPPGSDQLFLEVVQPACFICHSRRGSTLGTDDTVSGNDTRADGKDIDFSSYEKFISYAGQVKQNVFERGVMPLSLRGYNAFWADGSDAPEILASHLNGVLSVDDKVILNSENKVEQPGFPIADAGPNRTSTSPVRLFGSNSRFVERYSWSIDDAHDIGDAVLTGVNTARPVLSASIDGDYDIKMVAVYDNMVVTDIVHIKIDNSLTDVSDPPDPKKISFDVHIKPIFDQVSSDGRRCNECHSFDGNTTGTAIKGVPVFWVTDGEQPTTGSTWYQEVLNRVNFKDPESSLILTKPSNHHHYGGLRDGFDVDGPGSQANYDLILNWILEGAPES